jgi:hypothetical protein
MRQLFSSIRLPVSTGFLFVAFNALPVTADEIDDLKQQIEILARKIEMLEQQQEQEAAETKSAEIETVDVQNVVLRGDRRNSIKIPGTDTSLSIGGRIESSLIYDIGPRPTSRGGDIASARSAILEGTPEYENRGDTRFTARNSRFNIVTTTPTQFGQLRTYLEGDFNGPPNNKGSRATTNRTAFGIRHAYGELGNVLFGHYWSTFMDRTVFPTKIDGTGPVGRTFIRQGQLRYTHDFGDGGELAFALENPHSDFDGSDDENAADGYPDLISYYRYETDRWHMQSSGLLRRMGVKQVDPNVTPFPADDEVFGWGINQSASFLLPWNDDRLTWYVLFGDGIGRYLEGGSDQGATVTADGTLDTQFSYGGFVTYKHWWTETLASTVDFGASFFNLNPEEVNDANKKLYSSHLNLMWFPTDELEFGIEYIWGKREVHDGRQGTINRMQFTSRISF